MNRSSSCSQTSISCIKLICCAAYLLVWNTFCVCFLASSLCTSFFLFLFFTFSVHLLLFTTALCCNILIISSECNRLWYFGSNITCTFLTGATLNLWCFMLSQYQLDFTSPCTFPWASMSKSLLICKIPLIIFYTPLNNGWEALFSCLYFPDDAASGCV